MALVALAVDNHVATIMMRHNEKRNALSEVFVEEIIASLDECRWQRARAVILRAQPGSSVWSAGHDVHELPHRGRDPLGWADPLNHLVRRIEELPAPVIALIEGSVWGGACEVAFACDVVFATPEATFALTAAKIGVPYSVGGMLTFLSAAGARTAKEMAFTAKPVSAERLERLGIVNYVVPRERIESEAFAMARDIAAHAPLSVAVMKEQITILSRAHSLTPRGFERIQGFRRTVYDSADYEEGIKAFKERRKPEFKGE
jgi:methylmalonyl-CoA decarboxylase